MKLKVLKTDLKNASSVFLQSIPQIEVTALNNQLILTVLGDESFYLVMRAEVEVSGTFAIDTKSLTAIPARYKGLNLTFEVNNNKLVITDELGTKPLTLAVETKELNNSIANAISGKQPLGLAQGVKFQQLVESLKKAVKYSGNPKVSAELGSITFSFDKSLKLQSYDGFVEFDILTSIESRASEPIKVSISKDGANIVQKIVSKYKKEDVTIILVGNHIMFRSASYFVLIEKTDFQNTEIFEAMEKLYENKYATVKYNANDLGVDLQFLAKRYIEDGIIKLSITNSELILGNVTVGVNAENLDKTVTMLLPEELLTGLTDLSDSEGSVYLDILEDAETEGYYLNRIRTEDTKLYFATEKD